MTTSTVEPRGPALLARIQREVALKIEGFASRVDGDAFRDGFIWPLARYRISSRWGAQRILNGTPARPHYGIDLAAPAGTVVRAPADALVVLAFSTTMLVLVVLAMFADEHAALANRGFPVVVLWVGVQLVAVALSEATGRFVFWWLEPHRAVKLLHPSRYRPPTVRNDARQASSST